MTYKAIGGVHPNDKKAPANKAAITAAAAPPQVVIPMSLHIGAPCQPTVSAGDTVKLGQKIGDSAAAVSAPIHASVSGKVIAVEPRLHSNGTTVNSVVIENDGLDTPDETMKPHTTEELSDPEAIVGIIREAGIVGMGGATFPTAFKITSGKGKVDTVIINGAECEPYITSDHRTMLEYPEKVLGGIKLIMRACGVEKATLAVEDNKADAIELLKSFDPGADGIEIVSMHTRYPQGAEKQLIYTVTGKQVPPGGLPAGVGCAVFNIFTAYSVFRAACEGRPAIERVVTVSGSAIKEPKNIIVRVGTPVEFVFEQAGGFVKQPKKILMGGPMMGNAMYDLSVGTTKGTNALLAFCEDEDRTVSNPVCIRCGKCATVCPMKLLPVYMYMCERKTDFDGMGRYRLMDCVECGACTYNCPGKLHLTHSFRTGKAKIGAKQAEEKARLEAEKAKAQQASADGPAAKEGK
ncbi:MAG: electron transport complex subunit RsxC [Oscillospiraceae bacterium]|nr:electron transport complex subunit RsxC [Oscillospiraceae bacterium]